MLQAYKGVDFRPWLRGRIDGIPAEAMRRLLSARDLLRPGVLLHVVAQNALQRRYSGSGRNVRGSLAEAGFDKALIASNVAKLDGSSSRGLRRPGAKTDVGRLRPARTPTTTAEFEREARLRARRRRDAGAGGSPGTSAATPAPSRASPPSTPTPSWRWTATGWRSSTSISAQKARRPAARSCRWSSTSPTPRRTRAGRRRSARRCAERGRPELTLCLALIHHIVIGANIPMRDFHRLARRPRHLARHRVRRPRRRDGADAARQPGRPVRRLPPGDLPRRCSPRASTSGPSSR